MSIDSAVIMFAGIMTTLGALLTWLASPWFLLLVAFVGLNMIQASLTGFCPAALIFKAVGVRTGSAFN